MPKSRSGSPIRSADPSPSPASATGSPSRWRSQDLNEQGGVLGEQVTADHRRRRLRPAEVRWTRRVRWSTAGVRVVVGHGCSHSSLLAAGIYETADVLMITPSSTHPRLTEEGRQNVFRLIGRDDNQGKLAGDFLADRFAGKTDRHPARRQHLRRGPRAGGAQAAARARQDGGHLRPLHAPARKDYSDVLAAAAAGAHRRALRRRLRAGRRSDPAHRARARRRPAADRRRRPGHGRVLVDRWRVWARARSSAIARTSATAPTRGSFWSGFAAAVWAPAPVVSAPTPRSRCGRRRPSAPAPSSSPPSSETLQRGRFDTVLGRVAFDGKGDLEGAAWQWKVWTDGDYVPLDGARHPVGGRNRPRGRRLTRRARCT